MQNYFEETFVSGFNCTTQERAYQILKEIRNCHPATSGWEELDAGIRKNSDGTFTAWRKHRKPII